jgi:hypothetical protein
MTAPRESIRREGERGVALVMAIVVLLVISILAAMVMQNLSTERKISGHGLRTSRALSAADAGIAEVVSRLRSRDIALDETVPQAVVQIFLTSSGLVPAVGTDTLALATSQSSGAWLDYSSASRGPDVLTLAFRRDPVTAQIMRYDDDQTTPLNTVCGMPVYRITSTGKVNGDRTRVQAEMIWKPYHLSVNAALTSGVGVQLSGAISICGYQHGAATSLDDAEGGRMGSPSCVPDELGLADIPGVWSGGTVANTGGHVTGLPAPKVESQPGFYDGPWDVLGITRADFIALLGTQNANPVDFDGVVWMDNDGTIANGTQSYSIADLSGEGLLYVDGNLTLSGTVAFRGLIFVEGNLTSDAPGAVVGAVVVRGGAGGSCSLTNGPSIVFSHDAINEAVSKATKEFVTLSWREVR